jgi:hypothetical protein
MTAFQHAFDDAYLPFFMDDAPDLALLRREAGLAVDLDEGDDFERLALFGNPCNEEA